MIALIILTLASTLSAQEPVDITFNRRVLSIHREAGGHATTREDTCAAMEFMLREAGKAGVIQP